MNKRKKMAILATVTFSLFTCISCDKEQSLTESHNLLAHKEASENIPVFSSWESLQTAIDSAISFDTVSDLINYESKQGRQSIGAISDNFYESIDPNSYVDEEQFIDFYQNNKDLLDTSMVDGEICVSPKWFDTPYRYVANQNGLFAVDDLVYRLFKAGIVATRSENLDRLISLTESDLDNIDTSIFYYSKPGNATPSHSGCLDDNEDWYYSNTLSTAKNRVIVELSTRILFCPNIGFFMDTRILTHSQSKCFGIWWTSKHTHTCQGDVTLHRKIGPNSWEYKTESFDKTQKCRDLWVYVNNEPAVYGVGVDRYHYYSFHIKSKIPDLAYAILSHN